MTLSALWGAGSTWADSPEGVGDHRSGMAGKEQVDVWRFITLTLEDLFLEHCPRSELTASQGAEPGLWARPPGFLRTFLHVASVSSLWTEAGVGVHTRAALLGGI